MSQNLSEMLRNEEINDNDEEYDECDFGGIDFFAFINMFVQLYNLFHKKNIDEFESIKSNKDCLKLFLKKYKYFDKKNPIKKSLIYELFEYDEFKHYTRNQKRSIYRYITKKIHNMNKHGQSCKTELSCEKILSDITKKILTIAITKNSLLANSQFTSRFVKSMLKAGYTNMSKNVLIISSDVNTLNGNASHCKNVGEAWIKMCNPNYDIKVIFMCSNNTRIKEISELLDLIENNRCQLKSEFNNIHWDEAHNRTEGIPVYRNYAENILLHSSVKEFIPITASVDTIFDDKNPIWLKANLDKNRLNFINKDMESSMIKSDSALYSSIDDSIKLSVEDEYSEQQYNNNFNESDFKHIYPTSTPEDYIKKGRVNFCHEALIGDEEKSLNYGKTILSNEKIHIIQKNISNVLIEETEEKIFLKDVANYHLIITPCRQIITYMLMKFACLCEYEPVTIGLFGGNIYFRYRYESRTYTGEFMDRNSDKEFNDILYRWLNENNLLRRPVIIFGNYKNVGESNTFVNSKYGYLRSVSLLPGCKLTSEEIYQYFLRSCFIIERFKQDNPLFKKEDVIKFIIGEKEAIRDAETYEKQNDDYVQDLIDNLENIEEPNMEFDDVPQNSTLGSSSNSNTSKRSIPIQFIIADSSNENVIAMVEIMKKESRDEDDKSEFMENLGKAIEAFAVEFVDHNSTPINLESYTLKEFRCYRSGNIVDSYRFRNYKAHFEQKMSYKNGDIKKNECEIHCCINPYKVIIPNEPKPFINNPNTFYMTFAY
jgi:hypothetical protein